MSTMFYQHRSSATSRGVIKLTVVLTACLPFLVNDLRQALASTELTLAPSEIVYARLSEGSYGMWVTPITGETLSSGDVLLNAWHAMLPWQADGANERHRWLAMLHDSDRPWIRQVIHRMNRAAAQDPDAQAVTTRFRRPKDPHALAPAEGVGYILPNRGRLQILRPKIWPSFTDTGGAMKAYIDIDFINYPVFNVPAELGDDGQREWRRNAAQSKQRHTLVTDTTGREHVSSTMWFPLQIDHRRYISPAESRPIDDIGSEGAGWLGQWIVVDKGLQEVIAALRDASMDHPSGIRGMYMVHSSGWRENQIKPLPGRVIEWHGAGSKELEVFTSPTKITPPWQTKIAGTPRVDKATYELIKTVYRRKALTDTATQRVAKHPWVP